MSKVRILYWFRTDLRLHDSPALKAALDLNPSSFFPVWCWDPQYVYKHRVGVNRFRFLLESMQNLSESITKINPLSQLLVIRGEPSALLPQLWKRLEITHLCFEADVNGYARNRDNQIKELAKKAGIEIIERDGHQLYDIKKVVEMNNGKPIMNMNTYRKVIEPLKAPAKPVPTPTSLPSPLISSNKPKDRESILSELASKLEGLPNYTTSKDQVDLNSSTLGGQRLSDATCYSDATADFSFSVPTLESLGMDPEKSGAPKQASVPGGESEALQRLSEICKDAHYVATFAKPKTAPTQDTSDPATTLLSPYLKFGCLSVRKMWWDSEEVIKSYQGKDKKSEIPESLHGQLLFRDMYSAAELAVGDNFGRIRGNQISRFMDWYLPTHYDKDGKEIIPRPRGDEVSEARFEAFKAGQTGFPWIDALMRQLRSTGWIHHLGRHSLAAFLTRGQCWISWERGAEVFDTYLLDWDPASNPGNWMWLSCSAFFSQFFRVYGVATFPSKYDKTGALVRKWCPELAKYPDKFIYTPHLAPSSVQKEAGCIIGKDYPQPMLDEKESKAENLTRMKAAYAAKFYGTSKEVLEGKAEAILRKNHGVPDPKPFDLKKAKNDKIPDWAKVGNEKRTGAELKKDDGDEDEEVEMEGHEADVGDEHEEEEETGDKRKKKEESGEEDEEEEEEEKPKGKGKGKATAKKQKRGK